MKANLFKSFCIVVISCILISSCKKSSDTPTNVVEKPSIAANTVVVKIPSQLTQSSDIYANMAATEMTMVNALSAYSSYFTVPSNAHQSVTKSSEIVYTWSYGGATIRLVFNNNGTQKSWTWYFNDAKYLDCTEAVDGKSGSFNAYNLEVAGVAVLVYNWSKDATTITQTMKLVDDVTYFFKITSSLDGKSGQFDLYKGASASGVKIVEVIWNANGSGSWWVNDNGVIHQGSWIA